MAALQNGTIHFKKKSSVPNADSGWIRVYVGSDGNVYNIDENGNTARLIESWEVAEISGGLQTQIDNLPSSGTPAPIRATIGGDNSTIVASAVSVGYWKPVQDCTINSWTLTADVSGAYAEIELWKDTIGNFPPTVADKITASSPIAISGAYYAQSSTLTGWTTSISSTDVIGIKLNSVSGNPTKLELTVKLV